MEPLFIPARERSPQVDFHFDQHRLSLAGESYPEDAGAFYSPVMQRVLEYCRSGPRSQELLLEVALTYFNTSSAKFLMNLFQTLEGYAKAGSKVRIIWSHHKDDEMMAEFGSDFSRSLEHVQFSMKETDG